MISLFSFTVYLSGGCKRRGGATCCSGRGGGAFNARFLPSWAVGRVGDLAVVEQRGQGHHPGEKPGQKHQTQPDAAAVGASRCCFAVVSRGVEP